MFKSDINEYICDYRDKLKKDPRYLITFIENNPNLTALDIAAISGADPKRIRRIKNDLNIPPVKSSGPRPNNRPSTIAANIPEIDIPINWKDPSWLARATMLMGARKIARLVNVSHQRVSTVIKQLNLHKHHLKRKKYKHEFKTHAWLHYHYHILHYSKSKCARLANVSPRTMRDWFSQFGIATRAPRLHLPERVLWFEKCLEDIRSSGLFKYVVLYDHKIRLTLHDNQVIQLLYEKPVNQRLRPLDIMMERMDFNPKRIPAILPLYKIEDMNDHKTFNPHRGVSRTRYDSLNPLEQILTIINLSKYIIANRLPHSNFDKEYIDKEIIRLLKMADDIGQEAWVAVPSLIDQGIDPINHISLHFDRPKLMRLFLKEYKAVLKIATLIPNIKNVNIDYASFILAYCRHGRSAFKCFNINRPPFNPILLRNYYTLNLPRDRRPVDLNPTVDHYLAFALGGMTYNFRNNRYFNLCISGTDNVMRAVNGMINTVQTIKDDDVLLNPPIGYMSGNLKISLIKRSDLKFYNRRHDIINTSPIGFAGHAGKASSLMVQYY